MQIWVSLWLLEKFLYQKVKEGKIIRNEKKYKVKEMKKKKVETNKRSMLRVECDVPHKLTYLKEDLCPGSGVGVMPSWRKKAAWGWGFSALPHCFYLFPWQETQFCQFCYCTPAARPFLWWWTLFPQIISQHRRCKHCLPQCASCQRNDNRNKEWPSLVGSKRIESVWNGVRPLPFS